MLHGDISNNRSYVIGFRCENSLLRYKEGGLFDPLFNLFGKTKRAEVDEKVLSLMNYIYWYTEYTVVLIIDDANYTNEAMDYLADFPFNQVLNISSISEVTMKLNTGELTYFVTDDSIDLQRVNSRYAVTPDKFNTILRRRVRRFEES